MANLIFWNTINAVHAPIRTAAGHQVASWLRQHGYTVKVIDFCHLMTKEELAAITEKHIDKDTIAIGVGSNFWNQTSAFGWNLPEPDWVLNCRSLLEEKHPSVKWILGGANVNSTGFTKDWIKFHGYAEDSLLRWMDQVSFRFKIRPIFDITKLNTSFNGDDHIYPHEVMPLEMSRGCQFKCRFCSYPLLGKKKGTYLRDMSLVREELIHNFNEYGTTRYYLLDDTFNESEEKVEEFAKIVQGLPFEVQWTGYNRLDLIWSRQGTIQTLKDSGLKSTHFGIESFHPEAALAIGKGWSSRHAKDFLLELREHWGNDVTWYLSFIVGLPGEDQESLQETLKWCIDNKMYGWSFHTLSINKSVTKTFKSEFELEYDKYGYTFVNGSDTVWINDIWSKTEAHRFQQTLTQSSRPYQKVTNWLLSELMSHGINHTDLMHKYHHELPWPEFEEMTRSRVAEYVKFQLGG